MIFIILILNNFMSNKYEIQEKMKSHQPWL